MANDLVNMWGNFSLQEDEDTKVNIQDCVWGEIIQRSKLCIVGKLIADRWISKEIIRTKLIRGWKPMGSLSFKVLGITFFWWSLNILGIRRGYWRDDDGLSRGICFRWRTMML
jgi:hypothetical protein